MESSQSFKFNVNFRYEIQCTNQLVDNDYFCNKRSMAGTSAANKKSVDKKQVDERQSLKDSSKNQKKKRTQSHSGASLQKEDNLLKMSACQIQSNIQKSALFPDINQEKLVNNFSTPKGRRGRPMNTNFTPTFKQCMPLESQQIKNSFNRKGLTLISSLIIQVLEGQYSQNKQFTCGQISSKVLTEFCNKYKQKSTDDTIDEKERRTIKRRVYDSINVLIALGKIKKDRKNLYLESIDKKIAEEILEAKRQKILTVKRQFERKEQLLRKVKEQYQKLMRLKQRNQEMVESKEQGFSATFSTLSQKDTPHTIFKFPLLFFYTDRHCSMNVTLQRPDNKGEKPKQKATISAEPLYLLSDLSSLDYLNFKSLAKVQPNRKETQSNE